MTDGRSEGRECEVTVDPLPEGKIGTDPRSTVHSSWWVDRQLTGQNQSTVLLWCGECVKSKYQSTVTSKLNCDNCLSTLLSMLCSVYNDQVLH